MKNNKIQITGVATAETSNGNGNGHKKTEVIEKTENIVKTKPAEKLPESETIEIPDGKGLIGLYLSEMFDWNITTSGFDMHVDLRQFDGDREPRVVRAEYIPRPDDNFRLKINQLPDYREEYPSISDLDEYDGLKKAGTYLLAKVLSDLLLNPNLPTAVHNALFDALADLADPDTLPGADFTADFINEILERPVTVTKTATVEAAETAEEPDDLNKYKLNRIRIITDQVCHILESDEISDDRKEAFRSIIFDAGNEVGLGVSDPELIRVALPKMLKSFSKEFRDGIIFVLNSLLDSFQGTDFYQDELSQYEGWSNERKENTETTATATLTPEKVQKAETNDLASHLSAVLKSPDLPANLYNAISDELTSMHDGKALDDFLNSPMSLRKALANQKAEEAA